MTRLPASPRRILLIRPRGLGDVVLASAVIDALRRAYPHAALDFLSAWASRPLLEVDRRLDRVFLLAREAGRRGNLTHGRTMDAVAWMRRNVSDLVIDLFSNPRTAMLTALSGSPVRVGLARSVRRVAYNVRIPRFRGRPEDDHRWSRDVMLDVLRSAGIKWEGEAGLSVALEAADVSFASRALDDLGMAQARFAAVLPGGSWEAKRWTPEGFADAARALARESGAPVLIVWGPPEAADARSIQTLAGDTARLAPASSIREMAALLARAALVVSTDCFARHVAIAQEVPTVGVFGPTDPRDWTPPEGPHRTVGGPMSEWRGAIREVPGRVVAEAALDLWRSLKQSAGRAHGSTRAPLGNEPRLDARPFAS